MRARVDWWGPVPADFLSLHFVFTAGEFNSQVRFDPEVYSFGDEVLTGLRAFTWGYDLFHPHTVLGWHAYDRGTRIPHWADQAGWREQHDRSIARLRKLFLEGDQLNEGVYGKERSVADYEEYIIDKLVLT